MNSLLFRDSRARSYPADGCRWHSDDGGPFLIEPAIADVRQLHPRLVSLGETPTPVLTVALDGREYECKLEYRLPTGSFKDRGAQMLISVLKGMDVRAIVEDSSGNAGAAISTYAAAAGIECTIVVPRSAGGPVVRQIEMAGARLVRVPGRRSRATMRAQSIAASAYYASHIYNPLFHAGVARLADEIAQNGPVPDSIVFPAGNGTLLLGLYYGFARLGTVPRLVAAQVEGLDPLVKAVMRSGSDGLSHMSRDHSVRWSARRKAAQIAPGIASERPPRLDEMVRAVGRSGGTAVSVPAGVVPGMQRALAARGLYVESTSAVAPAAATMLDRAHAFGADEKVMIILTGSGLKRF